MIQSELPSTRSLVARGGELCEAGIRRVSRSIEEVVATRWRGMPPEISPEEVESTMLEGVRGAAGRGSYERREGVAFKCYLIAMFYAVRAKLWRDIYRRKVPGPEGPLPALIALDLFDEEFGPGPRRQAEALVRSGPKIGPDTWDAYEMASRGIGPDHSCYSREELRARGSSRDPIADQLERGGLLEARGPLGYPEIMRLLRITHIQARKHVSRTAQAVRERLESLTYLHPIEALDSALRHLAERRARSAPGVVPDAWDVYELMAYGVRDGHTFFSREELRARGVGREPVAALFRRRNRLGTRGPLTAGEVQRWLKIHKDAAQDHFNRMAKAIVILHEGGPDDDE